MSGLARLCTAPVHNLNLFGRERSQHNRRPKRQGASAILRIDASSRSSSPHIQYKGLFKGTFVVSSLAASAVELTFQLQQ